MAKYLVVLSVYASTTIEVEAFSEEQAKDIAYETASCPSICHHCANELEVSDIGDVTEVVLIG